MNSARDAPDGRMTKWKWRVLAIETWRAYKRYTAIPENLEKLKERAAEIRERREANERIWAETSRETERVGINAG